MLDDTDKGSSKPRKKLFFEAAPVASEDAALDALGFSEVVPEELLEELPVVAEVVAPVVAEPLLSEAERETALAWAILERLKAKKAAQKKAATEDDSLAQAAASAARKAELAKKIEALYSVNVGGWKGLDNYECLVCSYATLDAELIKVHVKQHI